MNDSGWNMYVFRDGRKTVRGVELTTELQRWLEKMSDSQSEDTSLGALIAAGELECALADANFNNSQAISNITDQLAYALVGRSANSPRVLAASLAELNVPQSLSVSVTEGFAYYALHPLRFAEPVRQLTTGMPIRIVGLRSIGTTLSAVVKALCVSNGVPAERISVRPTGHPYDRQLELTRAEQTWLRGAGSDAITVIVDEGPGLSGSSFLSVAESVERAGIPAARIVMLGSRCPDPAQLRAPNAVERWNKYRFIAAAPAPILPAEACLDLTSGLWRHHFLEEFDYQPATWAQLELAKYLNRDRRFIYKFHGYGHFADPIGSRSAVSFESGYSPKWLGVDRGFGKYEVVQGRLLSTEDLTVEIIQRAADYCAFRSAEVSAPTSDASELETMAKWNWQCEFGEELSRLTLPVERAVVADARMLPHEWIRTKDGQILKLDGSTHGDDHFFPGPCDIAWDLAGMIVEWGMDNDQTKAFLERYKTTSGDDAQGRIHDYVLAYSIFRMAWSKMASCASAGTFDEKLLLRDYARYRRQATTTQLLSQSRQAKIVVRKQALNSSAAI